MIIHRFWAAITGMHVLGSVLVASFWPQFSHILTPLQANGNCSFSNTFGRLLLMIVALLETVFLVVYHVVYHVLSYLYAQNSDVSVNWLGSAAMVVTGCMFASYYAWDSARKQRLASTRKQVQQHIEDCQWILRFDDKIRFVVRNQQEPPDFESDRQANAKLIAYMEFVEKQDLVHDQDLKDNIQPFLTAARQHPPSAITWNTDYEDKAGQLCTWLGKIEQIVQGTHECVKILTAKEDQRLLLRLKIAYLNLWEVVGRFHDLTITLTGNQTNANWNELQECVLKTLENREALYPPKKRINNTKPSTSGTLVDVSREKK
jgi:hypothetical protein